MAKKSQGMRNKARKKMKKDARDKSTVNQHLKEFDEGDRVRIDIDSGIHKGMPHHRFQGRTGTIKGKRGRSYIVEVSDNNAKKEFPAYPAHLKEA
ncbi:MAG: 50S ribosomal protein L21e [Candidatus Nanohaloarchaeota archaeon QJJ-9]|nr:50S ribosomal protein L21e [Candidatus Nanohaloarchaeota archaeon QJJ-9]